MISVYYFLLYFQLFFAPVVFISLMFIRMPYGRFHKKEKAVFSVNTKVGWFIMELPCLLTPLILVVFAIGKKVFFNLDSLVYFIFIFLWMLHYIQRSLIFPWLLKDKGKKMSFSIMITGFCFNIVNGYTNFYYIFFSERTYHLKWLITPYFIVGIILFITGYAINLHADRILRNLRKTPNGGYVIPNTWLYKYIVSPNYFGESIEWMGWALLTFSIAGFTFAIFTFANLAPRAFQYRKWYIEVFKDEFPKRRKAIIPFIF